MEVICTGRGAPRQLVQMADLHSEMRAHSGPEQGLEGVEVYTGEGKGESTSALGKGLRRSAGASAGTRATGC